MGTDLTASLPMYDFAEIRSATDQWWSGIARHMRRQGLRNIPQTLEREESTAILWLNKNLLFSQCCGFDVLYSYRDSLLVLATPDYQSGTAKPHHYHSRVVVHGESEFKDLASLENSVAAINYRHSHSGMNALMSLIDPLGRNGHFFRRIAVTGSHLNSLSAVQNKRADVAAIDSVTYALMEKYRPSAVKDLVTIARTRDAPALPYVTRINTERTIVLSMQEALLGAFHDPALAGVRDALLIRGGEIKPSDFYGRIANEFNFDPRLLDV